MFQFNTIAQYHTELKAGGTTCEQAIDHYLKAIEENKGLNAFVEVYAAEAREKAAQLDKARTSGDSIKKLHGVVIAIKDVISYKGHSVTAASKMLNGYTCQYTATALQYLLDEDAIIIGNCNCDEFAMGSSNENSTYGKVLNPHNSEKVPGGSSGGSAVAVAADMCMLSLGSDTGGSVRQPADHCGIIGFKPGYGRFSRYGLIAYASSFDQIGIFGNTIEDVTVLYDIMQQYDHRDSTMLQPSAEINIQSKEKPWKICTLSQVIQHASLDKEIADSIKNFTEKIPADIASFSTVDFSLIEYIVPAYYVLTTAEASSNLSRYDGVRYGHRSTSPSNFIEDFYKKNRTEGFGLEVKKRIMLGSFVLSTGYYDAYYSQAQKIRQMLLQKVEEIFAEYDAIIMPTVPATAPKIGADAADPVATYLADIFTVFANLTGLPGISIPLFSHSNNMPFGLQILTNKGNELSLLSLSEELMQLK